MTGQKLIIIFVGDVGFITPDNALTPEQLDIGHLASRFKVGAYWVITVLKFDYENQKLIANLDQCNIGEVQFSQEQLKFSRHLNEIKKISFPSLNTSIVLKGIASFAHVVTDTTTTKGSLLDGLKMPAPENTPKEFSQPTVKQLEKPVIYINDTFPFRIKDLQFHNGKVSFEKFFEQAGKKLQIDIPNKSLKEEFDAVKNYFEKVLNTKKVEVSVSIKLQGDAVLEIEANSPHINRINASTIENIRLDYVKDIINNTESDSDKLLFTLEELFDENSTVGWETFYQNEDQVVEDLMTIANTKHYKNLRFLSSKHDNNEMKLKFTIKPLSFVFLVSGQEQFHLLWETLDTKEATYVWHSKKEKQNLPAFLNKVEEAIKSIKAHGKRNYISSSEDDYSRIHHDYSGGTYGFLKWKGEIEVITR
jgi:hypothetical protein